MRGDADAGRPAVLRYLDSLYLGAEDEPFDLDETSATLVQVRNSRLMQTSPEVVSGEELMLYFSKAKTIPAGGTASERLTDSPSFAFPGTKHPLLLLIFDFSTQAQTLDISRTASPEQPVLWTIHTHGHGADVSNCISEMGCERGCDKFFHAVSPPSTAQDLVIAHNRRPFWLSDVGFRYPEVERSSDATAKRRRSSSGCQGTT